MLTSLLSCYKVKAKGRGQSQISRAQRSILLVWLCSVQQRVIRVITSLWCICNQGMYTDDSADEVGQLLIMICNELYFLLCNK